MLLLLVLRRCWQISIVSPGGKNSLSGIYTTVNLDVDELVTGKEEIVNGRKLKVQLIGDFGPDQL